jgi:hypothetical protein
MTLKMKAVYRNGSFVPETTCDLPEESEVELTVQAPVVAPPEISDPEERARLLKEITARMRQNPIPANAPRYTREQLHERR